MALSKWIRWLYFHGLGGSATMEYSNWIEKMIMNITDKKRRSYDSFFLFIQRGLGMKSSKNVSIILRWQYCHPFFSDGCGFYCLYCFYFLYLDIVLFDPYNCCPTASHFVCQLYSSKSTIRRNCKGSK